MFCVENGTDVAIVSVSGLVIPSSQAHHWRGGKEKKCCLRSFRWAEQQPKRKVGKQVSLVELIYFNTR